MVGYVSNTNYAAIDRIKTTLSDNWFPILGKYTIGWMNYICWNNKSVICKIFHQWINWKS